MEWDRHAEGMRYAANNFCRSTGSGSVSNELKGGLHPEPGNERVLAVSASAGVEDDLEVR